MNRNYYSGYGMSICCSTPFHVNCNSSKNYLILPVDMHKFTRVVLSQLSLVHQVYCQYWKQTLLLRWLRS
jgi:hypothetical protein